eukprot:768395-Hanusia_phi.AAC.2
MRVLVDLGFSRDPCLPLTRGLAGSCSLGWTLPKLSIAASPHCRGDAPSLPAVTAACAAAKPFNGFNSNRYGTRFPSSAGPNS